MVIFNCESRKATLVEPKTKNMELEMDMISIDTLFAATVL